MFMWSFVYIPNVFSLFPGSLFSCLMALDKVTAIAGSAVYSNIYAATLYFFKGTVFIVMAAFVVIAIVIIV